MRRLLGRDVAILRDRRRGGVAKPLPLRVLRERIEAAALTESEQLEIGGCGCFVDE
jgi:hypothetical protein